MSRRCHHGSPRHAHQMAVERRHRPGVADRPATDVDLGAPTPFEATVSPEASEGFEMAAAADVSSAPEVDPAVERSPTSVAAAAPDEPALSLPEIESRREPRAAVAAAAWAPAVSRSPIAVAAPRPPREPQAADGEAIGHDGLDRGATAPQLRRFIKSRAYVPMHELRRRFAINGGEDDVTPIDLERQRIYVWLPPREGGLLGELLRAGDIGYELSLDPIAPIVVGVYPMRPVPRN